MDEMKRGRVLVAAYLKRLRTLRGVEQQELADQLGIHKNTIFRNEIIPSDRARGGASESTSSRYETAVVMARALGGDVAHIGLLRQERLPPEYPQHERMPGPITTEVAADVASWWIERQDEMIVAATGGQVQGMAGLLRAFRWAAFREPRGALKVLL